MDVLILFAKYLEERVRGERGNMLSFVPSDVAKIAVGDQKRAVYRVNRLLRDLVLAGLLERWDGRLYMLRRGTPLWNAARRGRRAVVELVKTCSSRPGFCAGERRGESRNPPI
ncbi:MAG: DNA-binding protein [Pyrobaculum sp.]|uniref:DNA-binding protein n=1 Tax=Pyrobaculum sp. TaxID=2004705 RepID=UPI003EEEAA77